MLGQRAGEIRVAAWESEINDRVYRLYGLTKDEIKIVEEATNSLRAAQQRPRTSNRL